MKLPRRQGFSLIEAAIVLGIVGLVIGGIWAAASAVQRQNLFKSVREAVIYAKDFSSRLAVRMPDSSEAITYLIGMNAVPGGFTFNSTLTTIQKGQTHMRIFMRTADDPPNSIYSNHVEFWVYMGVGASLLPTNLKMDPALCISVSKMFLGTKLGKGTQAGSGYGASIEWRGPATTAVIRGDWTWDEAKPDDSTLSDYCVDTKAMVVKWNLSA